MRVNDSKYYASIFKNIIFARKLSISTLLLGPKTITLFMALRGAYQRPGAERADMLLRGAIIRQRKRQPDWLPTDRSK